MPCFFVLWYGKGFCLATIGAVRFLCVGFGWRTFCFLEEGMEENNYALKTKESIEKIKKTSFRSPLFLVICILQTVVTVSAGISMLSCLSGIVAVETGIMASLLSPLLDFGGMPGLLLASGRSFWMILFVGYAFQLVCGIISTVGGWQLYLSAKEGFPLGAFKRFRIVFHYYALENIALVVAIGFTGYLISMGMPNRMILIVFIAIALLFLAVPFYIYNSSMFKYMESLMETFAVGLNVSSKFPLIGLIVGCALNAIPRMIKGMLLVTIALDILMLIFFYRLDTRLKSL